ncbi:hypothetical protein ABEB36_013773 [Hypothenemus hampei]|uniref:Uncharacterized protein n=1 Tax=Hypothenemus hampei TaxID=57062 RepID=A0ABD1E658_HYPHA
MLQNAANIPLAICIIILRRFLHLYVKGPIAISATSDSVSSATTITVLSGCFVCLYHLFRKHGLVKIVLGGRFQHILRHSKHTIKHLLAGRHSHIIERRLTKKSFKSGY